MKKEELVTDNMRLVYHIARKYRNTGYEYDDLVQEGSVGLMKAAERFDPERGYRFSTLAGTYIENAIRMYLRSQKKHKRCILSLDQKLAEDGRRLGEILGFQQEEYEEFWERETLKQAVAVLDGEERELIRKYYVDGVTQRGLAAQYGIGQPMIHRRLKKILAKMKRAVE